ncbi:hypothetical protein PIB30_054388 [Stylosanthes scabra]|uniref:Endonuclease/exonuclease/phosphatase domain-containing protein n=1 Tax=Stylosanthes scabra TaxID=79078 RepID=A0ABU6UHJ1_9FABA|nr:hypothetical protein [Stylosanthes scabra]
MEAAVAKGVSDKSGLFFDSSDEEEVVARYSGLKVDGRKRSKKHRQVRNIPFIEGRTLAARKLRFWGFRDSVRWESVESVNRSGGDEKAVFLEELSRIKDEYDAPILFGGDFNEITAVSERKRCSSLSQNSERFRDWIEAF